MIYKSRGSKNKNVCEIRDVSELIVVVNLEKAMYIEWGDIDFEVQRIIPSNDRSLDCLLLVIAFQSEPNSSYFERIRKGIIISISLLESDV